MKKVLAILMALVLGLVALAGCSPKEEPNEGTNDSGSVAVDKFGGNLTIGTYADPDTLNPLTGNDIAGSWILNLIYPTLMELDENGNKVPYIIEEPKISEDGLTVTLSLIDGLKWQDGTPLTSKDIAFTYKTLYENKLQWQWSVLEGVTWETPDDKTIVFNLSKPFPTFITTIGFWQRIVPEHIWSKVDDIKNFTNDNPVGLGPFKLAEYERGQHYILESVDEWFLSPEGKPYLDKVIFKPYPDVNTMVLALKSGDIDLTAKEIPATAAKELEGNNNFTVARNMSLGYEHMAINLRDQILSDINVRKAMAMAVERKKIIDFAFDGDAVEMPGMISPVYEKFQIGNDFPSNDVEGAKKLLDEAGYKDTNGDGILNAPNGANLSFTLMFANSVSEHEKVARILVDNMKNIGIEIVPTPMDKSLQSDKLYNTNDWQLTINTWGIIDDVESSMSTLFLSSSSLNWMAWENKAADDAMLAMQSAITEEDIMKNMDTFQKEIIKDIPDVAMVVKKLSFAYSNKFKDLSIYPSNLKGLVAPQSLAKAYKVK